MNELLLLSLQIQPQWFVIKARPSACRMNSSSLNKQAFNQLEALSQHRFIFGVTWTHIQLMSSGTLSWERPNSSKKAKRLPNCVLADLYLTPIRGRSPFNLNRTPFCTELGVRVVKEFFFLFTTSQRGGYVWTLPYREYPNIGHMC